MPGAAAWRAGAGVACRCRQSGRGGAAAQRVQAAAVARGSSGKWQQSHAPNNLHVAAPMRHGQHPCRIAAAPTWVERHHSTHSARVHQVRPHRPLGHVKVPDLAVGGAAQQLVAARGRQEAGGQDGRGVALRGRARRAAAGGGVVRWHPAGLVLMRRGECEPRAAAASRVRPRQRPQQPHRVDRVQQLAGGAPPQAQPAVLAPAGQQLAALGPGQRRHAARVPRQGGGLREAARQPGVAQRRGVEAVRAVGGGGGALGQGERAALPLLQRPLHAGRLVCRLPAAPLGPLEGAPLRARRQGAQPRCWAHVAVLRSSRARSGSLLFACPAMQRRSALLALHLF